MTFIKYRVRGKFIFRNSASRDRLNQEPIFTNFSRCLFALKFNSQETLRWTVLKLFQNYWKKGPQVVWRSCFKVENGGVCSWRLSLFFHRSRIESKDGVICWHRWNFINEASRFYQTGLFLRRIFLHVFKSWLLL